MTLSLTQVYKHLAQKFEHNLITTDKSLARYGVLHKTQFVTVLLITCQINKK